MARQLYTKTHEDGWKNLPDETTPISAEALDHIEQGIYNNSDRMALKEIYGDGTINFGRAPEKTVGSYSIALGQHVAAEGTASQAEGMGTTASGQAAHAEGMGTTASGQAAHAEGSSSKATNPYTHAEGMTTEASGHASHAEGGSTTASGAFSHAEGFSTNAVGAYQHVQGKNNVIDNNGQYAHIVGGGTSDADRKNIHTLDWQGNANFAGNVTGKFNDRVMSLYGLQMEMEGRYGALLQQINALETRVTTLEEGGETT